MKTKTTTVRISKEKLDEIDRLCQNGSCRNTWINEAIDFVLNGSSDFDFGLTDEEEELPKPNEKPRYKVILDADIPKGQVTKVSYDNGKTWIDVKENN
jgi:predicted DNA-binding protein